MGAAMVPGADQTAAMFAGSRLGAAVHVATPQRHNTAAVSYINMDLPGASGGAAGQGVDVMTGKMKGVTESFYL